MEWGVVTANSDIRVCPADWRFSRNIAPTLLQCVHASLEEPYRQGRTYLSLYGLQSVQSRQKEGLSGFGFAEGINI